MKNDKKELKAKKKYHEKQLKKINTKIKKIENKNNRIGFKFY